MAFPLTEEQRKIVDDRGGELLVSAAAGSGKTRVLVERLLDRGAASPRSCPSVWPRTPTTAISADRPLWSIRPRSPPSTPSVPPCCGRAAICWT